MIENTATMFSTFAKGPTNGTAIWTQTTDHLRLRLGLWENNSTPSGTVFIFPGRSEYIENFGLMATSLDNLGYSTFVIDWRGQGLSDRICKNKRMGHVQHFTDYQKDVAAMINSAVELELPKPWFLLGHSMGGCIGLRALIEGLPVTACAFTAPMWKIKLSLLELCAARPLSFVAQSLGLGNYYIPTHNDQTYVMKTSFETNNMTSDPEMFQHWLTQAINLPDMQLGGASMGWLYQSLKEGQTLSKIESPKIPCITFSAGLDEVVDIKEITKRMLVWPDGKHIQIPNAKHQLIFETSQIRKSLLEDIITFFEHAKV